MLETTNPWNGLSPSTTQVLLCDLQEEIVARSKTTQPQVLVQAAAVLAEIANLFSLPITLSVVPEGQRPPKLAGDLDRHVRSAPQMLRSSASPFLHKDTVNVLASNGRKTLIIAGFATEVVVLQAALHAAAAGYRVLVAVDACGGMSERTEMVALRHIEASGAILTSVVSLSTALAPDFSASIGKQMFAIVQQLRLG